MATTGCHSRGLLATLRFNPALTRMIHERARRNGEGSRNIGPRYGPRPEADTTHRGTRNARTPDGAEDASLQPWGYE